MPFLLANTASGFSTTHDKDGNKTGYQYTGATKLDWLENIPPLSFMGKDVSPLSWIDDLLWGFGGDTLYPHAASNLFTAGLATLALSLRKDPYARRRMAMNISAGLMSEGLRSDAKGLDAAKAELEKSPWWWRLLGKSGIVPHPEGVMQALTRQLFVNKLSYSPADVGPKPESSLWEQIFGDEEARTMADAEWEYVSVYGDAEKMKAVLQKYPKYGLIVKFRGMDAFERAEYLANPDNRWIVPYVTTKNDYSDVGGIVTGADYYYARKQGLIRKNKKTNETVANGF